MSPSPNPWTALSLPIELTRMRSMLSPEEKQYLVWLTSEKFEGWGAIVDLGPWLGSSSAALAEGLSRRGSRDKILSLDIFKWHRAYMETVAPEDLRDGQDFLPLFMREIGNYAAWIEPRRQDLMDCRWDGGPIEILFVDAAKSWELTNAIFKGFGKYLIPARSRVVVQDFRYPTTHWLPLIFDSRPDLWREVECVEFGTTVTFVPLKPLDGPAGVHTDYSEEAFPLKSVEQLLRTRMAREIPLNRHWFQRMLYRKHLIDGRLEEARKLREELSEDESWLLTPDDHWYIEDVSCILVPRGWQAYLRHDYGTSRKLAERCLAGSSRRSVYAVALLGMSLLRLGDIAGAKSCIDEVLTQSPDSLHAKLYRAELALVERRYRDAEADGLGALRASHGDELIIEYSLSVLKHAWDAEGRAGHGVEVLSEFVSSLGGNPTFLAHLAREQSTLGRKEEAMQNVRKALELAPDHALATTLQSILCAGQGVSGERSNCDS